MSIEVLARLRTATDAILAEVAKSDSRPSGTVNWADLSCAEAREVHSDCGDTFYQVVIVEASPEAYRLQMIVAARLGGEFGHVEVITEW